MKPEQLQTARTRAYELATAVDELCCTNERRALVGPLATKIPGRLCANAESLRARVAG